MCIYLVAALVYKCMDPTLVAMRTKQQVAKCCPPGRFASRMTMTREVQFPRDFGGLFLEVTEVFGLEVGDVHQDAVRDAAESHDFPGFYEFRGEFDFAVSGDVV